MEKLKELLTEIRENILSLDKSKRVIDNLKADTLRETANKIKEIIKVEDYKKRNHTRPKKILEFTDMIIEKLQEIYDPTSQSSINFWEEARNVLNNFSIEDVLESLIAETGILEVMDCLNNVVSKQGQNVELWDDGYREYPIE